MYCTQVRAARLAVAAAMALSLLPSAALAASVAGAPASSGEGAQALAQYEGSTLVTNAQELQEAIASAEDDDAIICAPGTYDGVITFTDRSVRLVAQYPAYKDGVRETDESKLSVFTGSFFTGGTGAGDDFNELQSVTIDGFALSGDGLKVGAKEDNKVGSVTVRHCTMETGSNLEDTNVAYYPNSLVVLCSDVRDGGVILDVRDNYVFGTMQPEGATPLVFLSGAQYLEIRGNVFDVEGGPMTCALHISGMTSTAALDVADNRISGMGCAFEISTSELNGVLLDAKAVFVGSIVVMDNVLDLDDENFGPMYIGYMRGSDVAQGLLAGVLVLEGNVDASGNAVEASVTRGPADCATKLVTATYVDGGSHKYVSGVADETTGTCTLDVPIVEDTAEATFEGWVDDAGNFYGTDTMEVTLSEDTTFTARWTPVISGGHELPFSDVAEGDWYAEAVAFVYGRGLMTGYEGTDRFGPDDSLGREQAAMVLYRAIGEGIVEADCGLADVDSSAWYAPAVNWAVASAMLCGYGDGSGRFGVGDALTRDQFAMVIARAARVDLATADVSLLDDFSDGDEVAEWARTAIAWAVEAGILEGSGDGNGGREIRAGETVSRAEMATMIRRAALAGLFPTN